MKKVNTYVYAIAINLLLCGTIHAMTQIPDAETTPLAHTPWSMMRKTRWIFAIATLATAFTIPELMQEFGIFSLQNSLDSISCGIIDTQNSINPYDDNIECTYTIAPTTNISSTIQKFCNYTSDENDPHSFIFLKECHGAANRAYEDASLITFYGSLLPTLVFNYGWAIKAMLYICKK